MKYPAFCAVLLILSGCAGKIQAPGQAKSVSPAEPAKIENAIVEKKLSPAQADILRPARKVVIFTTDARSAVSRLL